MLSEASETTPKPTGNTPIVSEDKLKTATPGESLGKWLKVLYTPEEFKDLSNAQSRERLAMCPCSHPEKMVSHLHSPQFARTLKVLESA